MPLLRLCLYGILLTLVRGDRLHFVNLIYRHGERGPINSYPDSKYQEEYWKQGFGQLTQEGMRQQFRLGEFIRTRYDGFLSRNYSRYQINVVSTDVDRTLMSAECTLAGLYPPNQQQTWDKSIPWQPIPVHTGSVYAYYLPNTTVCPYYHTLTKKMLNGDWPKKMNKEYAEFFRNVSKNAGYGHILNITDIWHLNDAIKVERFHNLTQSSWITDKVFHKLRKLSDAFLTYMYSQHGIKKLIGGSLLEKLVSNMDRKIASKKPLEKQRVMDMYSLHDTTIAALMSAMGLYNGISPPYSACVGIELWKNNDGIYYLSVWYKNETNTEPFVLTVPGCNGTDCPFETFKYLMKDVLPGDMNLACRLPFYMNEYVIISFVTGAVFLMLLVLAILFCRSEVKARHMRYITDNKGEKL